MNSRAVWIDTAKGVAITLVVFGHAWRGLASADLISWEQLAPLDARIYAFHMPVFFVLSGYLYPYSLIRMTASGFAWSRVTRLIWPMVLWTYLFLGMKWLAGSRANTTVSFEDLFILPFPGILHFWFLWALFLISLALIPLKPLMKDRGRTFLATLWGLLALSLTISVLPLPESLANWAGQAIRHVPFFILGLLLSAFPPLARLGRPVVLAAILVFAALLTFWPASGINGALGQAGAMVLTICLLVAIAGTEDIFPRLTTTFGYMGRLSLAIFLSHTIFSAGIRAALLGMGYTSLWGHMILGTAVGLVGPIGLVALSRKTGTKRLLGL